jgi:hypothetical protein
MTSLKKPELQSNMESEFKYSEEANEKAKQDIQDYCLTYFDESVILADGFELAWVVAIPMLVLMQSIIWAILSTS